jgi:hypothetical protein
MLLRRVADAMLHHTQLLQRVLVGRHTLVVARPRSSPTRRALGRERRGRRGSGRVCLSAGTRRLELRGRLGSGSGLGLGPERGVTASRRRCRLGLRRSVDCLGPRQRGRRVWRAGLGPEPLALRASAAAICSAAAAAAAALPLVSLPLPLPFVLLLLASAAVFSAAAAAAPRALPLPLPLPFPLPLPPLRP